MRAFTPLCASIFLLSMLSFPAFGDPLSYGVSVRQTRTSVPILDEILALNSTSGGIQEVPLREEHPSHDPPPQRSVARIGVPLFVHSTPSLQAIEVRGGVSGLSTKAVAGVEMRLRW